MKKRSAYSKRAMRKDGMVYNRTAWLNALQRSRSYSEQTPLPGSWLETGGSMAPIATNVALRVRVAFDRLKSGEVKPGEQGPHDLLAHAIGVAWLRAIEIAGHKPEANPMLDPLSAGVDALRRAGERQKRLAVWGLDGPAIQQIAGALDVYDEILLASSPAQMEAATNKRIHLLRQQTTKAKHEHQHQEIAP